MGDCTLIAYKKFKLKTFFFFLQNVKMELQQDMYIPKYNHNYKVIIQTPYITHSIRRKTEKQSHGKTLKHSTYSLTVKCAETRHLIAAANGGPPIKHANMSFSIMSIVIDKSHYQEKPNMSPAAFAAKVAASASNHPNLNS